MQPAHIEAEYDDVDDLVESIAADSELMQIESGQGRFMVRVLASSKVVITEFNFSKSVAQRGVAPQGFSTVGLSPIETCLNWRGDDVPQSALINFGGQNGFEGVSGSNFTGVTVSFEQEFLDQVCDAMRLAFDGRRLTSAPLSVENHKFRSLRRLLRGLVHARSGSSQEHSPVGVSAHFEEQILSQFLKSIDQSGEKPLCRSLPERQRRLKRAIEYIEAQSFDNPSMPALCETACMSWRSLDRAFKERFGVGPKRYLMCYRLAQVRKRLKSVPADSHVSKIANEWGFWHMGQFASDYRKLFGELPSETLCK